MIVSLNMSNGQWTISDYEELIEHLTVNFGFTADSLPVEFHDLNFGCRVITNSEIVFEKNYPEEGVKYLSTDQDYIESFQVFFEYENDYSIYFWATDAGKLYEYNLHVGSVQTPSGEPDPTYNATIDGSTFVKLEEDPETDNFEGRVYHNIITNTLRIYHNGKWEDLFIAPQEN